VTLLAHPCNKTIPPPEHHGRRLRKVSCILIGTSKNTYSSVAHPNDLLESWLRLLLAHAKRMTCHHPGILGRYLEYPYCQSRMLIF
jgi:hypothetical protein